MVRRTPLVYGLLVGVWAVIIAWQVVEHDRVKASARVALVNRARTISSTLGLVVRSQRRFGGIVSQQRLESALKELLESDELNSVALLNASGEVVASAGGPVALGTTGMPASGVRWDQRTVTVVNLVDLGADLPQEGGAPRPTIVVSEPGPRPDSRENRSRLRPPRPPPPEPEATHIVDHAATNSPPGGGFEDRGSRDRRTPWFRRPFWLSEEQFKAEVAKKGVHGMALKISTDAFRAACRQDLWLRWIIGGLATVSALGFFAAWQSVVRSSDLQMRLLRASEMNTYLREMNVAAAGLAHETRNPLNIIRGLATMIAKENHTSPEIRNRSREITDEVDRVTAQLNEFIHYSRPREVHRAPVVLAAVVNDVVRALQSDLEDKAVRLNLQVEHFTIDADEQLLRQVLFNLLINAVQAVDSTNGEIEIVATPAQSGEIVLEVRDNGPGVPPDRREEVFRPYFTTHEKGSGLGLAVVKQIVLAHGWDIECVANGHQGAVFRLGRIRVAASA